MEKELREIQKGTEELLRRGAISPRDLTRLNLRLKPIVRQLEATYSKSRGALRPEMANVYHTMGELTDPTQASTREEGNRCSIKSLVAAGAVFKEEDAKVKIIAAPSSTSKDAVPQLLNIAHRYNRPPTKPSQARKWVVAAFEMDRILHGDDWSRFAERYAEDIEAFRLQSVVKECKPSVKCVWALCLFLRRLCRTDNVCCAQMSGGSPLVRILPLEAVVLHSAELCLLCGTFKIATCSCRSCSGCASWRGWRASQKARHRR